MQKELVLQFPKRKISLHSISNHTLTIIQRLSQCLPSPESPGFLNCCSLPGSPRRWSVSSSTRWGRFLPGDPPRSLTLPCGRSWWVGPSLQWVRSGLSHPERQNISRKRTRNTVRWLPPPSSQGSFLPALPSHQSDCSRDRCGWNLAGASRNVAETSTQETKYYTRRVGELRFITLAGPEELTLQALSPKQRG